MINEVIEIGRLTREPEIRVAGDKKVCSFSLAVDSGRKDARGEKITYFFNCVAWNKTAENICDYTHKGNLIAVRGRLTQRTYDDKDFQGRKVNVVEIEVNDCQFLEKKDSTANESVPSFSIERDDLPF